MAPPHPSAPPPPFGTHDAAQLPACQHRLEQVAGVHGAVALASPHDGVDLIDEQHNLQEDRKDTGMKTRKGGGQLWIPWVSSRIFATCRAVKQQPQQEQEQEQQQAGQ